MTVSSKVRLYDLAKELKQDTKRLIEEVRRERTLQLYLERVGRQDSQPLLPEEGGGCPAQGRGRQKGSPCRHGRTACCRRRSGSHCARSAGSFRTGSSGTARSSRRTTF